MKFIPNKWDRIRAFYRDHHERIMAAPVNEWGIDPYAWDCEMIFLTPIESWFWADIRACDAVLYPQYPALGFFVDFANPKAKVAIECDGAAYHQDKAKDEARDKRLTAAGWSVYRITGAHCRLEQDQETGALSIPHLFMQRICDIHGISRNGRSQPDPDGPDFDFESSSESIARWWEKMQTLMPQHLRERAGL